jgi:parvulin-like peptidyl-prolyl isomerase
LGLYLEQYQRWMERRFGPRDTELRQAFRERTAQATIRYFLLGPDAISLDPEAGDAEVREYYASHPESFRAPAEARIQYVKIPTPADAAPADSVSSAAIEAGRRAASDLLAAINAGAPAETAAKIYGGFHDSGGFRLGDPIRGLGRSDELTAAIRAGDVGAWLAGPVRVGPLHVIARIVEKKATRTVPLREAAAVAKKEADAARQEAFLDSLARREMELQPNAFLRSRVVAVALSRPLAAYEDSRRISDREIRRALDRARKEAGVADTAHAWLDSVRTTLPSMLGEERRLAVAFRAMGDVAKDLRKGGAADPVAARRKASVTRVDLYKGQPPMQPGILEGPFLDSLYALRPGTVLGPRVVRDSIFVVRLEALDPAFSPPYETVRAEARTAALRRRRTEMERAAEAWFADRRDRYMTPMRFVLDVAFVPKTTLDTLGVAEDSVRAYYTTHPLEFTEVARARVRHILVGVSPSDAARAKDAAREKALGIRERIVRGADFADVAQVTSDDKTSAARGGDLGELIRSQLVPEFGAVAFSIPVGQVSEPILTRYGYHLIRVDERTPERLRPLEESGAEIRRLLAEANADTAAARAARAMIRGAADSASFAALAAPFGGLSRIGPVSAQENLGTWGSVAGLGEAVAPSAVGSVLPEPLAVAAGYLVIRKVREAPPVPAPFGDVKDRVLADHQMAQRRAIAADRGKRLAERIARGEDLDSLFLRYGGLRTSKPFGRLGPIPDFARDPSLGRDSLFLERVFSSKPGAVLPPLVGAGGTLYAKAETITEPSSSEFATRRDELRRELLEQRVEAWTQRLRSRAAITIHRNDLKGLER